MNDADTVKETFHHIVSKHILITCFLWKQSIHHYRQFHGILVPLSIQEDIPPDGLFYCRENI